MVLRTHLGNHIERWPCRCFRARSTDRPREPSPDRPFDMRTCRDTSINSPPSCVRDRLSLRNKVWPDRPQWADRRGPHGEWGKNSQASSKFKRHRASRLISIDPFRHKSGDSQTNTRKASPREGSSSAPASASNSKFMPQCLLPHAPLSCLDFMSRVPHEMLSCCRGNDI